MWVVFTTTAVHKAPSSVQSSVYQKCSAHVQGLPPRGPHVQGLRGWPPRGPMISHTVRAPRSSSRPPTAHVTRNSITVVCSGRPMCIIVQVSSVCSGVAIK